MAVTIGDIAASICRPGEKFRAAIDRARNYADAGLFDVMGDRHPGTGKHIKYGDEMIHRAVLVSALHDAGILPAQASKIIRDCPDLAAGKLTIKLSEAVSVVIDGKRIRTA